MACLYTVHKCKSLTNEAPAGAKHFSDDSNTTICGIEIEPMKWAVSDNTFTGKATCKMCIEIDANTNLVERAKRNNGAWKE